eukprot:TRINITY_DN781930_c0_g1_i1.p1 TRINITY_DN781930_c0_g1~~TRINITY_DN781930_c0_g1_i1.p1  ORF type:complete len:208 (+),score=50.70 TRINITY_DN781930_c0_g1_i1:68-691(+)
MNAVCKCLKVRLPLFSRLSSSVSSKYHEQNLESELQAKEFVKYLNKESKANLLNVLNAERELSENKRDDKPEIIPLKQLKLAAIYAALPMIGFGFFDNFIMIVSGDMIETWMGSIFCLSTMAAAGFGNTISDLSGLALGDTIDSVADKIGLPKLELSHQQLQSSQSKWWQAGGRSSGMVFGCLIGMFPLLFIGKKKKDEDEEEISSN